MRTKLNPFLICLDSYYYHIKQIRVQDAERGESTQSTLILIKYHQISYYATFQNPLLRSPYEDIHIKNKGQSLAFT